MKQDLTIYQKHIREELTPCKKERGKYICPIPSCRSGERAGGDGAFSIDHDEIHGKCFSCGFYGDIFDLYAARDGLSLQDATRAVMAKYGNPAGYTSAVSVSRAAPAGETSTTADRKKADDQQLIQIQKHITACHAAIKGSPAEAYLKSRGLTDESIQRFRLGYDASKQRLIIPHDPAGSYFISRRITDDEKIPKYMNPKNVDGILFNADALYQDEPCFVVESDLCAISIEQVGGHAIALAGTGGQQRLLTQIRKQTPTCQALIVSLDNDDAGRATAEKLVAALEQEGLYVTQHNISGDFKDPNELLKQASVSLWSTVTTALNAVKDELNAAKRELEEAEAKKRQDHLDSNAYGFVDGMLDRAKEFVNNPVFPTGFKSLDRFLDGGFRPGLYMLGAVSSLGKTSLVIQIADQVAKAGRDILYFSLEMSRDEIMAKSISRNTLSISRAKKGDASLAKSTRGILAGDLYKNYSYDELATLSEAIDQYKSECAHRIWIVEGVGDVSVYTIREAVEKHIKYTGNRPLVVLDYCQILSPIDPKDTDKRATDKNVLELKRISRDLNVPVLGISSLNRDNYTAPINMAAFKESGAIEYGTDVLLGLQLVGMDYRDGEGDKEREKRIRELRKSNDEAAAIGNGMRLELKVLKNRNGMRGTCDPLIFTPRYNHFAEEAAPSGFSFDNNAKTPFDRRRSR